MLPRSSPPCQAEDGPSSKIIELRQLLAEKFPATAPPSSAPARLLTGLSVFDEILGGGLPNAAITEIVCPLQSAGSGTAIHALIGSLHARGQRLALVDAANAFDPEGLSNEELSSLLWVQCASVVQALTATDLLLRDGNLPLVILDLVPCAKREVRAIASTYWYRLQRVLKGSGSTALVFSPAPVVACAACTLKLTKAFELTAMTLLRDQLTASLGVESVRTRLSIVPARDTELVRFATA